MKRSILFFSENAQRVGSSCSWLTEAFTVCCFNLLNLIKDSIICNNYTLYSTRSFKKHALLGVVLSALFVSGNMFSQVQQDLRLLTDAYIPGQCPANDIRVVSASIDTGDPCNACNEGSITVPLTIRVNHNTESHGRHLAVCGTIVETLPGGGVVNHNISRCFGPLLKNSQQIGGGQDLAPFNFTFNCGSTLLFTDILLVWTAANGECPVTLANNPNGKYCWESADFVIPTQINATETHVDAGCYGSATGSINLSVTGGAPPYTYAWSASAGGVIPSGQADDQDLSGLVAGTYSVVVTDSKGCTDTVSGIAVGQQPLLTPSLNKDPGSVTLPCNTPLPEGVATVQDFVNNAFNAWLAIQPVPSGGTPFPNPPFYNITRNPVNPQAPQQADDFVSVTVEWTVTDACGRTAKIERIFSVVNPCRIQCGTVPTNVSCFGGSNGSILAGGSGGIPPYNFYLFLSSDVINSPIDISLAIDSRLNVDPDNSVPPTAYATFNNLAEGTYTIVITDLVQDLDDPTACPDVTIIQPNSALSSQISDVDVLCYGGATGSIDLSPSGGTPPYTYAWSAADGGVIPAGQADDQDLSGLVAGTYSVVITDANGTTGGCRAENSAVISQPAAALSSQISDVDVLCYGAATGSINLSPSGGTPPYTYAWSAANGGVIPAGQEDDQDLSGLVAGTYSVVITDANGTTGGCRAENSAVISQPAAALSSQISDVDVLCYGGATGSINLTPSGGTPPYAYAWSAANGGVIPAGQEDDQDLSGLVAGTYSVVITDANGTTGGCRAENSAVISQPAAALSSQISDVDVLCYGGATGSIDLSPSGGTPPYTYAWSAANGGVIPAGQADDQDLSGLVAGTYSVVITDANGTTGGCRAENSAVISQPAAALSSQISDVDVLCYGAATGSINLSPSGGTPPYTYAWSAADGGVIPAGQEDDQDLSGLVAGTYSVVITDANGTTGGCRAENSAVISQPASGLSSQISDVDVLCYGGATGSINLTPSGGVPPYAYAWSAANGGVIPAGQEDDQDLSGLVAGTYSVVITDANGNSGGCRAENSAVISQPAAALSSQISDVDVLCYGAATGSIDLSPSGGTPPYTYAWSAANGGVIPAGQADDQDLSGLVAGTYSVVITDANGTTGGCRAENSAVISQPAAALSSQISDVDVLCYGAATGSINLSPSGGTPPYTYAWSAADGGVIPAGQEDDQDLSGLVAGTYSVVITDANGTTGGCRAENSAVISQPASGLSATETHVNVLCNGGATGSIDLSPSGGVPPYAYAWSASDGGVIPAGQADDQDLSGLVAGTYEVIITDANGNEGSCRTTKLVIIIEPDNPLSSQISDVDVLCYGAATGSIDLTPSGGTPPYAYAWSAANGGVIPAGQEDDQDLSGLVAGTYSVVITDANGSTLGCRAENSAVISQPAAALSSQISDVDVLCYGAATGSINLTPSGGTPPYTYAWSAANGGVIPAGQEDDQDLSGLVAGTYSVVITDANGTTGGCRAENSAVISQPAAALSSQISDVDVLCYGGATGSINLTPSGGTPPYTYAWSAANGGVIPAGQEDDQDLSGLVAGTYSVVITDANGTTGGCRAENSAVISQPNAALSSQISDVDVLCYGAATGSINLSPSGGTPPYTYAWSAANGGVIPAGQADDQDLSGLVAGTYSVVITDANGNSGGCRNENSAVISQPNAALSSQISDVDVLCYGDATGSINLTPSGGTPPYAYAWSAANGGVIPAGQADDQDLSGLVAGTYSVVITDANGTTLGCRNENSAVISQPNAAVSLSLSSEPENCAGTATGSITATFSGGVGNYMISLDGGAYAPATSPHVFNNLSSGPHSVAVKDGNNCPDDDSINVDLLPCDVPHCSLTQGFYGNVGGLACGLTAMQIMSAALPNTGGGTYFDFGAAPNYFRLTSRDIASGDIFKMLPGGGTPRMLIGFDTYLGGVNWSSDNNPLNAGGKKVGKINNNLLSQTITLFFNRSYDPALGSFELSSSFTTADVACNSDVVIPFTNQQFSIPQAVINYLGAGADVNDLFALANYALGHAVIGGGLTHSQVNAAVDAINNGFDQCRIAVSAPAVVIKDPNLLLFTAYPVPFKENLTIRYDFNYQSKARIEMYDYKGTILMSYDDPDAYQNKEVILTPTFSVGEGQMYFIKVITDRDVSMKKVISNK